MNYYDRFVDCPACDNHMGYIGEYTAPDQNENCDVVYKCFYCDTCNHEYQYIVDKIYK